MSANHLPEPAATAVDETVVTAGESRRLMLAKLGRFAAVTAPAVTLMLAVRPKPAVAATSLKVSSRQLKVEEGGIDPAATLGAIAALPVGRWRYKAETGLEQRSHIGPYAEDFQAAFGVGDGATINTTDALGVCLAAIKALSARVESLEQELRAVRA